jgi:hypothetical protein
MKFSKAIIHLYAEPKKGKIVKKEHFGIKKLT